MKNQNQNTIKAKIDGLDASSWIAQLVSRFGWAEEDARLASEQYKRFLWLKYLYRDQYDLPPSKDIDEVWHIHILETRTYHQDTQAIFGEYFHHHPQIIETDAQQVQLAEAFEQTKRLYLQEFGEPLVQIRYTLRDLAGSLVAYLVKKLPHSP